MVSVSICYRPSGSNGPCLLVLQLRPLTADRPKARYLCKMHLVAGVMPLDTLKKSNVFYTLTGKAAEIDTTEGVSRAGLVLVQVEVLFGSKDTFAPSRTLRLKSGFMGAERRE